MHLKKQKAFTLVELIVVIVILAILATVAFLSYNSQSASARDSGRLSDMSSIGKGLGIYSSSAGKYPAPDNSVMITASGTIISYQGYAGDGTRRLIKLSAGGVDPSDGSSYTYSVNDRGDRFELLGFLENGSSANLSFNPFNEQSANADSVDYSKRFPYVRGDILGIIMTSTLMLPVQSTGTGLDISNSSTGFMVQFTNKDNSEGTGGSVFSSIYNRRTDLLSNKSLASSDPSLMGYWDMETLNGGMLKDLSLKGNDGTCYNLSTPVACGSSSLGPQITTSNSKFGKSMFFDGVDDWIKTTRIFSGSISSYSIFAYAYFNGFNLRDPSLCATNPPDPNIFSPIVASWNTYTSHLDEQGFKLGVNFNCNGNSYWQFYSNNQNVTYGITSFDNQPYSSFSSKYGKSGIFLGVTFDKGYSRLFMNGKMVASSSGSGSMLDGRDEMLIGKILVNSGYMNGYLDELRIYNRSLSDTEINALYNIK